MSCARWRTDAVCGRARLPDRIYWAQRRAASADYAEQANADRSEVALTGIDDFITLDAAHHDYHLEKYLAVVAAAIEQVGWVSP